MFTGPFGQLHINQSDHSGGDRVDRPHRWEDFWWEKTRVWGWRGSQCQHSKVWFNPVFLHSFINVLPDPSFRGIEFALEKMKKKEVAQVRAVCSNLSIQKTAPASREQSQHFPHPIIDLHSLSKYLLTMYETGENTLARAFCQLQYFLSWNFNFLQITLKPAYGFGTAGCSQLVPEAFIIFAQFFH